MHALLLVGTPVLALPRPSRAPRAAVWAMAVLLARLAPSLRLDRPLPVRGDLVAAAMLVASAPAWAAAALTP